MYFVRPFKLSTLVELEPKLLRGNEIVYKLRSFVDFGVPLNYNFGLRTFPVSAAQIVANGGKMGGIEERWHDP